MKGISNSVGKDNGGSGEGKRYVPDWDNTINLNEFESFTCPSDGWICKGSQTNMFGVYLSNIAPKFVGTFYGVETEYSYNIDTNSIRFRVQEGEVLTALVYEDQTSQAGIIFVPEK